MSRLVAATLASVLVMAAGAAFGQNAGIVWTAAKSSPFGGSGVRSIVWGKDKFVAVGDKGKMAYSPDGATWTAVKNSMPFSTIAWGNGKFVAGGGVHGNDGEKCHKCNAGETFQFSSGKMAYSSNGTTWTEAKNIDQLKTSAVSKLVWKNDKFVVSMTTQECACGEYEWGYRTTVAYSPDGITWTVNKEEDYVADIVGGNGMFIEVFNSDEGYGSAARYSSDGANGDSVEDYPFSNGFTCASAWGGNKFVFSGVAVGEDGEQKNMMAYSSDGKNWTLSDKYPFGSKSTTAIAWGNGIFVAGSDDGKFAYSK